MIGRRTVLATAPALVLSMALPAPAALPAATTTQPSTEALLFFASVLRLSHQQRLDFAREIRREGFKKGMPKVVELGNAIESWSGSLQERQRRAHVVSS